MQNGIACSSTKEQRLLMWNRVLIDKGKVWREPDKVWTINKLDMSWTVCDVGCL